MFDYEYDTKQIISELGIDGSTDEFKGHVLLRIDQLLDERMKDRVEAMLSDEQVAEFNQVEESPEAARALIEKFIPEIDTIYQEELNAIVSDLKTTLEA